MLRPKWHPMRGFCFGDPLGSEIFQSHGARKAAPIKAMQDILAAEAAEYEPQPIDPISAKRELLRRRYRHMPDAPGGALFNFTKHVLGYEDLEWEVHGELCRRLEEAYYGTGEIRRDGNIRRYLFLVPRGCYKTTIATISFPIWMFYQNEPPVPGQPNDRLWQPPVSFNSRPGYDQRLLLGQAIIGDAKKYLENMKNQLEDNGLLHELFGRQAPLKRHEQLWTTTRMNVGWRQDFRPKEANVTVTSMDSSLVGGHYDMVIGDDLIGEKQVTNEDQIRQTIEWYQRLMPIMQHKEPVVVILVGTRWHDADLYGWLLEHEPEKWRTYIERAERTPEEQAEGKRRFFFPQLLNEERLEDLRGTMRPYLFSCQYYNDPVQEADGPFKAHFFDDVYYDLPDKDEERQKFLRGMSVYTTCDPAITKEKRACYATVVSVAWDHNGVGWVLDLFRKRRIDPDDLIQECFRQHRAWNPIQVGIEQDGFQRIFKWYADRVSEETGIFPRWEPLKPNRRAKELRILGLEPLLRNKRLRFRKAHTAFEDEALRFPKGKYRDALDALAYQLDIALPGADESGQVAQERFKRDNPYQEIFDKRLARLGIGGYVSGGITDSDPW